MHPLERIHPRNFKLLAAELTRLIEGRLWAQVLAAMALGIGTGVAIGPAAGWVSRPTAHALEPWLSLPGDLFLATIQMVVVPLVLASVVRGIAASGDLRQLRSTGLGLATYFVLTTLAAIGIGLTVGQVLQPGHAVSPELRASLARGETAEIPAASGFAFSDVPGAITRMLPQNPLSAMAEGQMLQTVIFAAVLGVALITLAPESSRPLLDLMGSLQQVAMRIVSFVMRFAPIAVFGMLAKTMAQTGSGILVGLALYAGAVIMALSLLLGMYLALAALLGRHNPLRFLAKSRDAMLLAFSTDSSAATMPVSIRVAEENLKVRPSTAQFVIPVGATMNMGGTACYHGIATMFMAQLFGMQLGPGAILALMMTSLGASIGAPATPGVGIMILASVLGSAGVPLAGLALVIGLDQMLERVRCVMNVSGDLVACIAMDRFVNEGQTREQELQAEHEHERRRARSGEDVVTT